LGVWGEDEILAGQGIESEMVVLVRRESIKTVKGIR
jgi:hypothetical protein